VKDDTISRQAAIDALDEIESEVADGYGYQYPKWRKYFCELPSAQPEPLTLRVDSELTKEEYDKLMQDIKDAPVVLLPSAQPEPQWIPCSERLPEGITQVIIQTNGEAIHEAIYMGKDDYGHYVWKRPDNEIYWDEEVVAWMPLPTPYQPKEDICK